MIPAFFTFLCTVFKHYIFLSSYGDDIVMAGFEGTATSLDNGNFDMTNVGTVGRVEVAKKGIVVLNNFMYTIREFEVSWHIFTKDFHYHFANSTIVVTGCTRRLFLQLHWM